MDFQHSIQLLAVAREAASSPQQQLETARQLLDGGADPNQYVRIWVGSICQKKGSDNGLVNESEHSSPPLPSPTHQLHSNGGPSGPVLYWAARNGCFELTKLLLAYGANPARCAEPYVNALEQCHHLLLSCTWGKDGKH